MRDVGEGARELQRAGAQPRAPGPKVIRTSWKHVHGKGRGTGPQDEVGSVLYTRRDHPDAGRRIGAPRQERLQGQGHDRRASALGHGKPEPGPEEAGRSGLWRRDASAVHQLRGPMGSTWARVHTWDGSKWNFSSDWYQADEQILKPMVRSRCGQNYLADKKMTRRDAAVTV